jgi:hypothetical protein
LDDDEWESVWAEVARKREAWADDHGVVTPDFVTCIRGGAWTRAHRGKLFDHVAAMARKGLPSYFCDLYTLNKMTSFSIAKFGEDLGTRFAVEWTRKMQCFYDIWRASGDAHYTFSDDDISSIPEDSDFLDAVAGVDVESVRWPRAMHIRNMRPHLKVVL